MNEKLINAAMQSYSEEASKSDALRLRFFKGIWKIQQTKAEFVAATSGYEPPSSEEAEKLYWGHTPILSHYPVSIDATELKGTLELIAQHFIEFAGLEEQVVKELSQYDWDAFADKVDRELAGSDPSVFINDLLETIDTYDVDSDLPATVFAMIPSLALRAFLQEPASAIMQSLDLEEAQASHERPLLCPACGSKPTLSLVGESDIMRGRGRTLYCGMCGTEWVFERIRCARCGSKDQTKLHYFHIEGDDAHRLQSCQECGDYIRVIYQDSTKHPICMEVEDVVMARLDMVAHDERFREQA